MESTGQRGRVQVSEETAEHLIKEGKQHWLVQRAEKVHAKGKGALQTFWIVDQTVNSSDSKSVHESASTKGIVKEATSRRGSMSKNEQSATDGKTDRLINWNVDVLQRLLKQVVARRISLDLAASRVDKEAEALNDSHSGSVLSEVKEIIALPYFNAASFKNNQDPESVVLDDVVKQQLIEYVSSVAAMYRGNPFHNFEHARYAILLVFENVQYIINVQIPQSLCLLFCCSHVTMSVV